MKRRLFSALSLLLFVAVVVLWVRSYGPGDYVRHYDPPRDFDVQSSDGLLRVSSGHLISQSYARKAGWDSSFWPPEGEHYRFKADLHRGTTMGFRYQRWHWQSTDLQADARIVTLPYWSLATASAILPAAMLWRWHRSRRARGHIPSGRCPSCGYDLWATPRRCPECGHVVSTAAMASRIGTAHARSPAVPSAPYADETCAE